MVPIRGVHGREGIVGEYMVCLDTQRRNHRGPADLALVVVMAKGLACYWRSSHEPKQGCTGRTSIFRKQRSPDFQAGWHRWPALLSLKNACYTRRINSRGHFRVASVFDDAHRPKELLVPQGDLLFTSIVSGEFAAEVNPLSTIALNTSGAFRADNQSVGSQGPQERQ